MNHSASARRRVELPALIIGTLLIYCVGLVQADHHGGTDAAQSRLAPIIEGAGTYSRPISTDSAEAQAFFDQGLRLAWGFYFPESILSYQTASHYDPDHPMPYWGLAHAMGPNPNSRYARMPDDPKGEGLKAIKAALDRIERASPIEAELIRALFVLYDKEAIPDNDVRDQAYLSEMRALNKKYPDHSDIAALYAGAYMSIGRWDYWDSEGNPKAETLQVAEALEHIMATDLTNPGVLHLHVHLIEASLQPERALVSADALEATVPIAGHVVHMPAHIYVRVGQYQQAIENNRRSQEVDIAFAKQWGDRPLPNLGTYPLSHKIHASHAVDFIRYAATVQGNYEVAIEAADKARALATRGATGIPGRQKQVAAPWLVDKIFGQWDKLLATDPGYQGSPYLDGIWSYALGGAHIGKGDLASAKEELAKLQALVNDPKADEFRVGATPVRDVLRTAALALEGEVLEATGDLEGAIVRYREAVAIEDQNNYTEPPDWPQPIRHYLGAALIAAGRAEEAEAVYRRDLRWNQNNGWSLFGLQQALALQGKTQEADAVKADYRSAWRYSGIDLARSRR
ncbi:MAG: tetratricopeptide repeat protein [Pseudomonadales bacterium]